LGAKRKRERKRTESEEPQGFTEKMLIVENFFVLQGQKGERRAEKELKGETKNAKLYT
jgi:hypothetical protein